MKQYDVAVIIGRFQPIHKGHIANFIKAAEIATCTVVILGSANAPRTIKNPFTAEERESMICEALKEEGIPLPVHFAYVEDSFYREQEWIKRVKDAALKVKGIALMPELRESVADLAKYGLDTDRNRNLHIHLHGINDELGQKIVKYNKLQDEIKTLKIAVVGHEKDKSSYYLKNFIDWDLVTTEPYRVAAWEAPICSTEIRHLWFVKELSYESGTWLHRSTMKYLEDFPHYEALRAEFQFVRNYKKSTQLGPFPVQFLTTDAIVLHGDEILLIKRADHPGKGLWALPGGFKHTDETFFDACLRELKEETKIAVPEKVLRGSLKEEKMFDYPSRSIRGTTVSMAYSFVLDPSLPRPRVSGGDDAAEAWWFPLSEVVKMRDQIFEDHLDMIEYMTSRN